jgi:hypothetical protein
LSAFNFTNLSGSCSINTSFSIPPASSVAF